MTDTRKEDFLAEFTALLKKYGAEFNVGDDGQSYGMHSGIATIDLQSTYEENGDIDKPYTYFELPTYINGTKDD